jgi:hypothetical protein
MPGLSFVVSGGAARSIGADMQAAAIVLRTKVLLSSEVMVLLLHGGKFPVDFADT